MHRMWTGFNLAKAKAIQAMEPLVLANPFFSYFFCERISYVQRFIYQLVKFLKLLHKLLKKNVPLQREDQQKALQRVKDVVNSSLTIISPLKGHIE